jgi:hypothetical protein
MPQYIIQHSTGPNEKETRLRRQRQATHSPATMAATDHYQRSGEEINIVARTMSTPSAATTTPHHALPLLRRRESIVRRHPYNAGAGARKRVKYIIPIGLLVVLLVHLYILNLNIMDPTRLLRRRLSRPLRGQKNDNATSIIVPDLPEDGMRSGDTRRQQQQHLVARGAEKGDDKSFKLRLLPASIA